MFVHRKDYYRSAEESDDDAQGQATIIVAKQRNGPIGDIELSWLREFTRFEDLAAARFNEFDEMQPAEFG